MVMDGEAQNAGGGGPVSVVAQSGYAEGLALTEFVYSQVARDENNPALYRGIRSLVSTGHP